MNTINERLKFIIEHYYNGNVHEFERICGLNKDTLKHVVGGRMSKPSFDSIELIIRTNVRINPYWIITGEGSMENNDLGSSELVDDLKNKITELNNTIENLHTEIRVLREVVGLGERK